MKIFYKTEFEKGITEFVVINPENGAEQYITYDLVPYRPLDIDIELNQYWCVDDTIGITWLLKKITIA